MNQKRHSKGYIDCDNNCDNEYINESCFYCGEEFIHIEDILVDERDRYICEECSIVYRIDVVRCREID